MDSAASLLISTAAVVATVAGIWLAHNYRRQMTLRLSETRLEAYSRLWEITGIAAPTRLDGWGDDGYLRPAERRELWSAMTDWYYAEGGGMLLTADTKTMYLNVKHNLVCESSGLRPNGLTQRIRDDLHLSEDHELDDMVRGKLAISLLSLLRTQLKSDLAIYGSTYSGVLSKYEIFFLKDCGVDLGSKAWAEAAMSETRRARLAAWLRLRRGSATKEQPSPLRQRDPILEMEGSVQTPSSSREAIMKELSKDSNGS